MYICIYVCIDKDLSDRSTGLFGNKFSSTIFPFFHSHHPFFFWRPSFADNIWGKKHEYLGCHLLFLSFYLYAFFLSFK